MILQKFSVNVLKVLSTNQYTTIRFNCFYGQLKRNVPRPLSHPLQTVVRNFSESIGDYTDWSKEFSESHIQEKSSFNKWQPFYKICTEFSNNKDIKEQAFKEGINQYIFSKTIERMKAHLQAVDWPEDLEQLIKNIYEGNSSVHDFYAYFRSWVDKEFPHCSYVEELQALADLKDPVNWYPEARQIKRHFIFHGGPTNSGKTYQALQRFLQSESGVYCGPLKLLATEVNEKSNKHGTPCDLITGEQKNYAVDEEHPSSHVACTIEMSSTSTEYEVAVIDEIQMIQNPMRGWAWTRAVLGLAAKEIHVCGEKTAISLVQQLLKDTDDTFEVRTYERKTPLSVEPTALGSLDNIQAGDCIVCFSIRDIISVNQQITQRGIETAIIYGGLPPNVKLAEAEKFNDPDHPCKVMVATDAIGMGINLSIRRVIFWTLKKPVEFKDDRTAVDKVPVSEALQIGGRAGRFNTQYDQGFVTCLSESDMPLLNELMNSTPAEIKKAGLHPTNDQFYEMALHLPPHYQYSTVLNVFKSIAEVDVSQYFLCNLNNFCRLAERIDSMKLDLPNRYLFCSAPIENRSPLLVYIYEMMAKKFSEGEAIRSSWLLKAVLWPLPSPMTSRCLARCEEVFSILEVYLWLNFRKPMYFPDREDIVNAQNILCEQIQSGLSRLHSKTSSDEMSRRKQTFNKSRSKKEFRKEFIGDRTLTEKQTVDPESFTKNQEEQVMKLQRNIEAKNHKK